MSDPTLLGISIATTLPSPEQATLRALLERHATLQHSPERLGGPAWETFVAIMRDVDVIASGGTAMVIFARELLAWRKHMQQQGTTPAVKLTRPDAPPIDLATATDEEVLAWLLMQNP